jgi:hypothetical protein
MAMYFKLLTENAYIQRGNYSVSELYSTTGDNFLVYNPTQPNLVAFPQSFYREWSTVTSTEYDWGAYATGLQVAESTDFVLPTVTRRTLLYFFDLRSTAERRTLVETTKTADELVAQGVIASDGVIAFNTFEDYVEKFTPAGRLDFGGTGTPVLPDGITVSNVSELYSYNATIDGVNLDLSNEPQPVQVYVSPTWINNQFPIFDRLYFADDLVRFANGTYAINAYQNKPLRQVRWFGGVPSENIAAINRVGTSLDYSTKKYTQTNTLTEQNITENGQEYFGADSYNVVNLKRS